ncbi:thiamine biosynthesis oxidoreductase [Cupriavidus sp. HMR-1]|nr:thiamine biosynthesis oxidoreductase [Cupriavidus sp. HMR-1]
MPAALRWPGMIEAVQERGSAMLSAGAGAGSGLLH